MEEKTWSGEYWSNVNNQRKFFDEVASKLNIQKPEDWYRVTGKTVIKFGGHFIKRFYNGSLVSGTS
jgi:hypothetical protein